MGLSIKGRNKKILIKNRPQPQHEHGGDLAFCLPLHNSMAAHSNYALDQYSIKAAQKVSINLVVSYVYKWNSA